MMFKLDIGVVNVHLALAIYKYAHVYVSLRPNEAYMRQ